ncbi:MAG: DegT/DnrJ/EryC1/StrS family aminotransferase [Nannocystaceae bacterium]|nr:DegT/DnrJ/EryC1/StrS family aminotransferase [Nannocystaceae bacterium]
MSHAAHASAPAGNGTPIPYVDLAAQFAAEQQVLGPAIVEALAQGQWIGGAAIERFELEVCAYTGARHTIAVASGTDALVLSLRALDIGPGDEVITPPNSFVASTAAIVMVGARPVFADVLPDQGLDPDAVARVITPRTRAIMPVHLTGRIARVEEIGALAERFGLAVIEDAAQAFGSRWRGVHAGRFGTVGCFSAHPLKNLNAVGDAGFVVTDDDGLAVRLRRLRNNGLVDRNTVAEWGTVSRLDTIQAVVLCHRLAQLDGVLAARRHNAARYQALLDPAHVYWPACAPEAFNSFHTFVVQLDRRDALQQFLAAHGIGSSIHYPVPIHLQPAARALGHRPGDFPVAEAQAARILSLPIHQFLRDADIERVAATIAEFYR